MPGFSKLVKGAALRLENEHLITFMKSFSNKSDELAQAGEVSERDRPFMEAFQKVYEAISHVEEKTRQLETSGGNADDLKKDAKERLGELHNSLDRLQTSTVSNPLLQPFAGKVVKRAHEMSQKLEEFAQEEFMAELDDLYGRFKNTDSE